MENVPKGRVLPGTRGPRGREQRLPIRFHSSKIEAALGVGGGEGGTTLGLDRKQWNKRIARVVACLRLGSMFLKSSERPAGQVLSSRAGQGAAVLHPALEKSGTPV